MCTVDRFNRIANRRAADKARKAASGTKARWQDAKRSRGDLPYLEQSETTIEYEMVPVDDLVKYGDAVIESEIQADGRAEEEASGETSEAEATEASEVTPIPTPKTRSLKKVGK